MKSIFVIIVLLFITAFFYINRAVKSFKISLHKVNNIYFNKKHLQGALILKIENKLLPKFDITEVNLDLYLNDRFLTKVQNYRILSQGFIEIKINLDLKKILTTENIISFLASKKITIYGNVGVKKEILEANLSINETVYL